MGGTERVLCVVCVVCRTCVALQSAGMRPDGFAAIKVTALCPPVLLMRHVTLPSCLSHAPS